MKNKLLNAFGIFCSLALSTSSHAQVTKPGTPATPSATPVQAKPSPLQLKPEPAKLAPARPAPAPITVPTCTLTQYCYVSRHDFEISIRWNPEVVAYAALVAKIADTESQAMAAKVAADAAQTAADAAGASATATPEEKQAAKNKAAAALATATDLTSSVNALKAQQQALGASLRTRGIDPSMYAPNVPPPTRLSALGFIQVVADPVSQCPGTDPNALIVGRQEKVWPSQDAQWLRNAKSYCMGNGNTVGPDETVVDPNGRPLQSFEFPLPGTGQWYQEERASNLAYPHLLASGSYLVTVGEYTVTPDKALLIKGYAAAWGVLVQGGRGRTYAFSHVALKIVGDGNVGEITTRWDPTMESWAPQANISGAKMMSYDPVSVRLIDATGRLMRRDELLGIAMRTGGKGATGMYWRRDGSYGIDAADADLEVRRPLAIGQSAQLLKLGVRNGVLTERTATHPLLARSLPALGTTVRSSAPTQSSSAKPPAISGAIQHQMISIPIPALQRGQRFDVRLGGAGGQMVER